VPRSTPARATWPAERIAALEESAQAYLDPTIPDDLDVDAAYQLLAGATDGPERLFETATKAKGVRRSRALNWAVTGARGRPPPSGEAFFPPRLETILAWLKEDDRALQLAVFGAILPRTNDREWLKAHRTGPDAPIVEACRKFLHQYPKRLDFFGLVILNASAPEIDPRDVELVVTALDRVMEEFHVSYQRTFIKPQGRLDDVHAELFRKLRKYADRDSVKRLLDNRRGLEEQEILR
jgi:hypothetical protein